MEGNIAFETQSKIREIVDSERFNNIVFIFMTTFTFLNMFVAIFTNTVVALEADSEEGINSEVRKIQTQLDVLVDEIKQLREGLGEE
ncbi:MAG: hypothetical protein ACJZ56_07285 [Candidatus Thalassarchaeaceae archaeon]